MANEETMMTPVLTEYSPDAKGRYGLLTWEITLEKIQLVSPSITENKKIEEGNI